MPTSAVISEAEYFCPMPRPRLKRFMLTLMLFVALELSPLRVDAGAAASVTVTLNKRDLLQVPVKALAPLNSNVTFECSSDSITILWEVDNIQIDTEKDIANFAKNRSIHIVNFPQRDTGGGSVEYYSQLVVLASWDNNGAEVRCLDTSDLISDASGKVKLTVFGPPPEPTNLEVSHVTNTSSNFSIAPCTMLLNWTTPVSNAGGVNATFDLHLVDLRTQAAGDVRGIVGTTWYTLSSAELEAVLLIGGDGVGGLCGGEGEGGEGEGGGGGGGGAEGDGCRWFGVSVTAVNDAGASPSSDKVNFTFPSVPSRIRTVEVSVSHTGYSSAKVNTSVQISTSCTSYIYPITEYVFNFTLVQPSNSSLGSVDNSAVLVPAFSSPNNSSVSGHNYQLMKWALPINAHYSVEVVALNEVGASHPLKFNLYTTAVQRVNATITHKPSPSPSSSIPTAPTASLLADVHFALNSDAIGCILKLVATAMETNNNNNNNNRNNENDVQPLTLWSLNVTRAPGELMVGVAEEGVAWPASTQLGLEEVTLLAFDWMADGTVGVVPVGADVTIEEVSTEPLPELESTSTVIDLIVPTHTPTSPATTGPPNAGSGSVSLFVYLAISVGIVVCVLLAILVLAITLWLKHTNAKKEDTQHVDDQIETCDNVSYLSRKEFLQAQASAKQQANGSDEEPQYDACLFTRENIAYGKFVSSINTNPLSSGSYASANGDAPVIINTTETKVALNPMYDVVQPSGGNRGNKMVVQAPPALLSVSRSVSLLPGATGGGGGMRKAASSGILPEAKC